MTQPLPHSWTRLNLQTRKVCSFFLVESNSFPSRTRTTNPANLLANTTSKNLTYIFCSLIFVCKMCVFVSRPVKIATFLRKNRDLPKRVVDFLRERDTFRNTIMEIVEDFDEKSYNNNGKPWKSSRILRVKPNFFIFLSFFIIFLLFFVFSFWRITMVFRTVRTKGNCLCATTEMSTTLTTVNCAPGVAQ